MPFKPNQSGNPQGRKPGSKNKSSAEVKNLIHQFVSANIETLQNDFDSLEPKDRLLFFERILKFVLPQKFSEVSEYERMSEEDLNRIIQELRNPNNDNDGQVNED